MMVPAVTRWAGDQSELLPGRCRGGSRCGRDAPRRLSPRASRVLGLVVGGDVCMDRVIIKDNGVFFSNLGQLGGW